MTTHIESPLLELQYNEITRQESRVDAKGDQLVSLMAALTTIALYAATTQSLTADVLLSTAGLLWLIAVIVLLIGVIKPRFNRHKDDLAQQAALVPSSFYSQKIAALTRITTQRYQALNCATWFICAGFGPIVLAAIYTTIERM